MLPLCVACVVVYCVGIMLAHDPWLIHILYSSVHNAMG